MGSRDLMQTNKNLSSALSRAWSALEKNLDGHLEQDHYCGFLMRATKFLAPELSRAEAEVAVQNDWLEDSGGHGFMTYKEFCNGIFELTDLWCPGEDAEEYAHFVDTVVDRTCVAESINKDGSKAVTFPQRKLAFVPESSAEEHWTQSLRSVDSNSDPGENAGTWHEIVTFDLPENSDLTTYRYATIDELYLNEEDDVKPAFQIRPGQQISKFWSNLHPQAFEETDNAMVGKRHVALQKRQSIKDSEGRANPEARKNFKKLFNAISRSSGELTSLKQIILERHLILFGHEEKKTKNDDHGKLVDLLEKSGSPPLVDNLAVQDSSVIQLDPYDVLVDLEQGSKSENSIWLIGKSGAGTEKLAAVLAHERGLTLISPSDISERALERVLSKLNSEEGETETAEDDDAELTSFGNILLSGGKLEDKKVGDYISSMVIDHTSRGCGYVLEGYPLSEAEYTGLDAALRAADIGTGFNPHSTVRLEGSDEDLAKKREGTVVDMESGVASVGMDRHSAITSATNKGKEIQRRIAVAQEDEEPDEDLIAELEEQLESIEVPTQPGLKGALPVRQACDTYEKALAALQSCSLPAVQRKGGAGRTVVISAMQPSTDIAKQTILRLEEAYAPFGRSGRPCRAVPLLLPEGLAGGDDDAAKRQFLLYGDPEECVGIDDEETVRNALTGKVLGGVSRRWSRWGCICPIAVVDDKNYEKGDFRFAAVYKRSLFLMSSEERLAKFVRNPLPYVTAVPETQKKMNILIVAPTLGAGEAGGKFVSNIYGLCHIDCREVIEKRLANPGNSVLNQNIGKCLTSGQTLPDELLTKMVMQEVAGVDEKMKDADAGVNGWVVTGYGMTETQADSLIAGGLKPDKVIIFSSPEGEEAQAALDNRQEAQVELGVGTKFPTAAEYEAYSEAVPAVKAKFEEAGIVTVEMPCSGALEDIQGWVAQLTDQFNLGEDPESDKFQGDEPPLGRCKSYCPVSLFTYKTLVPGNEDFTVQYRGEEYRCCDQSSMDKFRANPLKYLPIKDTAEDLVKPFIALLGPIGSGTEGLLKTLSENLSLDVVDVASSDAYKRAVEEGTSVDEDGETVIEPVSPNVVVNIIAKAFEQSKGILLALDTNVFHEEICSALMERRLFPSFVLPLEINADLAAERMINRPDGFEFVPPETNPENEEEDEAAVPPTKAELEEMRQEQWDSKLSSLVEQVSASSEACETLKGQFEEAGAAVGITVQSNVGEMLLAERALKSVQASLEKLSSVLSSARSMETSEAKRLLFAGYNRLSRFGPYCPVAHLQSNGSKRVHSDEYPVMYRELVYLCGSEAARGTFCAEPNKFLRQTTPLPSVTLSCAVVGGPKSGKTTLALLLSKRAAMTYLTELNVLEWAREQPDFVISKEIRSALNCGGVVGDDALVQALKRRTDCEDCQTNGWVLDGFPNTEAQAMLMVNENLVVPGIIFNLKASTLTVMSRSASDLQRATVLALQDGNNAEESSKPHVIFNRYGEWQAQEKFILALFKEQYHNVKNMFSDRDRGKFSVSKFSLVRHAGNVLEKLRVDSGNYLFQKLVGRPAPIFGVPIDHRIVTSAVGHMLNYCPVSFIDSDRLVAVSLNSYNSRAYSVEYGGRYYFCSNRREMKKLCTNPGKYLSGKKPLPPKLPWSIRYGAHLGNDMMFELELQGYCPVLYKHGKGTRDWESIVEADPTILAEYGGKFYGFSTHEEKNRFMEEPWNYIDQTLPVKLPPKGKALKLTDLRNGGINNVLAVAEQSLSDALQRALVALGNTGRIRHPSLTVEETAVRYISLHLKANNKHAAPHLMKRRQLRLAEFVKECQIGEKIKGLVSGGSAIKAIRSIQSQAEESKDEYSQLAVQFEALCKETPQSLRERFIV